MNKCHEKLLYINTGHQFKVICLTASLSCFAGLSYANPNAAGAALPATAQNSVKSGVIKGNVIDEAGMPMIGVSIVVKGTTNGTITDFDGNFSLEISGTNAALELSYIGYQKKTINAVAGKPLSAKLDPEDKALDEVVVIGYGTVKKRDLTGAVTSVKSEDITLSPSNNPMEGLQGRVAGLDITRSSGQPGEGVKMQLRGTRSFSASGNPLFIIDGMPGDYATLNPNDIESIEVLKDASSTAVYGAAGANGVIIITTKKGKEGKMAINVNISGGYSGWSTLPEMRSGESYINVLRDAQKATGTYVDDAGLFSTAEMYQSHLDGKYINWADALMQDAYKQNYSVSVSGGTEKTKAYFSLNYSDEEGQYKGDDYKVYSTNMSIDHKLNKWLSAGMNFQGSYVDRERAYARLINAMVSTPLGELYDAEGNVNVTPVFGSPMVNLLLNQDRSVYRDMQNNLKMYVSPYIELRPFKGFTVQSRLNVNLNESARYYFQGMGSYQYYDKEGAAAQGTNKSVYAQITKNSGRSYKWENIFTYNFNINKQHDFTLTGVTSWSDSQSTDHWQYQDNIKNNSYLWYDMKSGVNSQAYSNYTMSKGMGFVGRLNYSYMSKYLFSASVRHDGSSVLAAGNRWCTFPAVSAGWTLTEESFMENTKDYLDNLKIRAGYGVTGTAGIKPYNSVAIIEDGNYSLGSELIATKYFSKQITNPDLTWEKSYNANIGVDVSFFNRRIDITADYYNTKTEGVIWHQSIPITNGGFNASTQYTVARNIANTKNNGFEFALNTRNIVTKNFKWDTSLTFTTNNEKITEIIGGTADHIKNNDTDFYLNKGHFINSYYDYKIAGIWQKNETADAEAFNCAPGDIKIDVPGLVKVETGKYYKKGEDGKPITDDNGDIIYYTKDNKYSYSGSDYQVIGHNAPKWTLGMQNKFTYKDFDLTVYAFFRYGQMIKYDMLGYYDPKGTGNFPTHFNYWTENNPSNDFPAINSTRDIGSYTGSGALAYVDGSYFKIKNITLGYTLPANLRKKLGIGSCRVYGTLTNPFVFAKSHLLKDYDPEMNGSLNYPLTKQLVFGLNLSF